METLTIVNKTLNFHKNYVYIIYKKEEHFLKSFYY